MANYEITNPPVYNPSVRRLENTDPANAETTFNPLVGRLIENTAAVKKGLDEHSHSAGAVGADPAGSAAAVNQALQSHTGNGTIHISAEERSVWNSKAAGSHSHDDRYYTEAEINNQMAGKAASSHAHSAAQVTSGTFGGEVTAPASGSYDAELVRNIKIRPQSSGAGWANNGTLIALYK